MKVDILTLFPDAVMPMLSSSILGRAAKKVFWIFMRCKSGIIPRINSSRWMIIHMAAAGAA